MPPVIATRVHPVIASLPEAKAMARLHQVEKNYVVGMKRKERNEIVRIISTESRVFEVPLRIRVLQSNLPESLRLRIFEDLTRVGCEKYLTWVEKVLRLPFGKRHNRNSVPDEDLPSLLSSARLQMDSTTTGHSVAKREVLKILCQSSTVKSGVGYGRYSLGLEGPPGTGKTHFVKHTLSRALGRPLVSIGLGGASDISYLLGSIYVYEGSKEGRLANALMESGCCDPIIHFDEVDKVSQTEKGQEIISALIHLVDPTANASLQDRYFHNVDIDFSECTFVFSYNDPSRVSPILLDRMIRISMPSPSDSERETIVRDHIVPRVQKRIGSKVCLSDEATRVALSHSTKSGEGMRGIEKTVDHILSTADLCLRCGEEEGSVVGADGTRVLDEGGNVSSSFASRVLLSEVPESGHTSPPPLGMYS